MRVASIVAAVALACSQHVAAANLDKQIDELFTQWTRSDSPGCSVAATQDGRIEFERGYGMADLEQGVAIRPDTVFNMASVSKQFTSTAILLLAEEGKLSLNDSVRKYVPEVPDYGKTITLRMLANHTSGLRDYPELLALGGWNWVDEMPEQRIRDTIARQKALNFTPGSKYTYSNSGYVLMAMIVHRVSGQTLGEFAAEHIFRPLGMLHSRFYDDRRMIVKNRAIGHQRDRDSKLGVWRPTYEIVGDGAVLTTVQDMALWERNLLEPRLGRDPAKLVAQLSEPATLLDGSRSAYGLGQENETYRGLPAISHGGGIPGYSTYMLRFPAEKFSVQLMCNEGNLPAGRLAHSIANLYLEGKFTSAAAVSESEKKRAAPTEATVKQDLQEFAGAYRSEELDAKYQVQVAGTGLSITVGYLPATQWLHVDTDRFSYQGMTVRFKRHGKRIVGFVLSTGRIESLPFERIATK